MAKVKILTAAEAANLVEDGMTVSTNGFVACDLPEELTSALEKRFLETGSPKNLTYFYAAGQGNRDKLIFAIMFAIIAINIVTIITDATISIPEIPFSLLKSIYHFLSVNSFVKSSKAYLLTTPYLQLRR